MEGTLQSKIGALVSLLWDVSFGRVLDLLLLSRNAAKLEEEMELLKNLRDDLSRKLLYELAKPDMEAWNQVEGWFRRVEKLESAFSIFQASFERQSLCITGFCLGYEAAAELKQVRALIVHGNNIDSVAGIAVPDAETIAWEADELRMLRDDIVRMVEVGEAADVQMRRTNLVESWLNKAAACLRSEEEGGLAFVREVRRLKEEGNGYLSTGKEYLVSRVPPGAVEELPCVPSSFIVGGEATLSEIRDHLGNDAVRVVGICGIGGSGKTTLLKRINNELLESAGGAPFDTVIWAIISKEVNLLGIQKQIGDRLGLQLSGEPPARAERQNRTLFKALCRRQFLLFLDDVWAKLDLAAIGIPHPAEHGRRNCKIIFTTRSLEVCTDMDADRIVRMKPLSDLQSLRLFRRNLQGEAVLRNPSTLPLAIEVVTRCGGLPMALITVAKAMANKRQPVEWESAIRKLDDAAAELRGMGHLLFALKFSYDALEDDTRRSCLLYCALFPEDQEIGRDELVEHWVVDGLLDKTENERIDRLRGRGNYILSALQDACLLETGFSLVKQAYKMRTARMHDTVRDMALHLGRDRFLAMAGKRLRTLPPKESWEFAERISFMYNYEAEELPAGTPNCPKLTTLLLNNTGLGRPLRGSFFSSMNALRTLDLSRTKIEEVPPEVGSLAQLRCINLAWTSIKSLPTELGNLGMLRELDLEHTTKMESFPPEVLPRLTNLVVLKMWFSGYLAGREVIDLGDLEGLARLEDLQIDLGTSRSLKRLLASDVLSRCTTSLTIDRKKRYNDNGRIAGGDDGDGPLYGDHVSVLCKVVETLGTRLRRLVLCDEESGIRLVGQLIFRLAELRFLEHLRLHSFGEKAEIVVLEDRSAGGFSCLCKLEIYSCDGLKDLSWAGDLRCLQYIMVNNCKKVEQILIFSSEDGDRESCRTVQDAPFPRLREMRLHNLPELRSISRPPLRLPALEELFVFGCPQLGRLPVVANSAPKMIRIRGTMEWWDGLQWEDRDAAAVFLPRFCRLDFGKMFALRASRTRAAADRQETRVEEKVK